MRGTCLRTLPSITLLLFSSHAACSGRLSQLEAAIKIQSVVRMHQTRRRATVQKELTIAAVVTVQAVTKGFITRQWIKTGRIHVRRPWLHGHISRAEAERKLLLLMLAGT